MKDAIFVISHKPYRMPSDSLYKPLQVGFGNNIPGFLRDNTGDNISKKNADYCELTGMYWAWKNSDADIKGIVHYRRFFTNGSNPFGSIEYKYNKLLDTSVLEEKMESYDIILPRKRHYYIQNLSHHYGSGHDVKELLITRDIIEKNYPEYLNAFDTTLKSRSAHMFNMLIAKDDVYDSYCKWLFSLLFNVERAFRGVEFKKQESRVIGYISELMMDVWVRTNKPKFTELPVTFIEGQNYLLKGSRMISDTILSKIFNRPI